MQLLRVSETYGRFVRRAQNTFGTSFKLKYLWATFLNNMQVSSFTFFELIGRYILFCNNVVRCEFPPGPQHARARVASPDTSLLEFHEDCHGFERVVVINIKIWLRYFCWCFHYRLWMCHWHNTLIHTCLAYHFPNLSSCVASTDAALLWTSPFLLSRNLAVFGRFFGYMLIANDNNMRKIPTDKKPIHQFPIHSALLDEIFTLW